MSMRSRRSSLSASTASERPSSASAVSAVPGSPATASFHARPMSIRKRSRPASCPSHAGGRPAGPPGMRSTSGRDRSSRSGTGHRAGTRPPPGPGRQPGQGDVPGPVLVLTLAEEGEDLVELQPQVSAFRGVVEGAAECLRRLDERAHGPGVRRDLHPGGRRTVRSPGPRPVPTSALWAGSIASARAACRYWVGTCRRKRPPGAGRAGSPEASVGPGDEADGEHLRDRLVGRDVAQPDQLRTGERAFRRGHEVEQVAGRRAEPSRRDADGGTQVPAAAHCRRRPGPGRSPWRAARCPRRPRPPGRPHHRRPAPTTRPGRQRPPA